MRLFAPGAWLLALAPLLFQTPASAETLDTVYSVTVRGFPVGRAELKAEIGDGHYAIRFSGGITGLARLFAAINTTASSEGSVETDRLDPSDYQHVWTEDDDTETVAMRFSGRRLADVVLDPPRKRPERYVPITDADRQDVLDPATAFVWPVEDVTPEACGRTVALMDGRRRFNLDLSYDRMETFSTRDRSFSARAVVCKFKYKPVAGHRKDKKNDSSITNKGPMEIWVAPAGDGLAVPARIQISTRIGRIVMTATKLSVK